MNRETTGNPVHDGYIRTQETIAKLQVESADYKNSLKIAEGEYEQLGREYEELQAELAGALAEIVTANDISVSVARLKADNTMLVEQCCDKTHALDVSVHNAELAKKAIEQKHERVRYFENRNTQLATENMNQAEQITRLKKELNHGNEGYQILRDEITKLKGE